MGKDFFLFPNHDYAILFLKVFGKIFPKSKGLSKKYMEVLYAKEK